MSQKLPTEIGSLMVHKLNQRPRLSVFAPLTISESLPLIPPMFTLAQRLNPYWERHLRELEESHTSFSLKFIGQPVQEKMIAAYRANTLSNLVMHR